MKIKIATSITYGNYKRYLDQTMVIIEKIVNNIDIFKANFDFREDATLLVRPIRGNTLGQTLHGSNRIELDPRRNIINVIETFAHELVHSEQHKHERLQFDSKSACWIWDKKQYKEPKTFKAYFNLPWEIEARERATSFIKKYRHQFY